ncbi:DUF3307 domain-containing protein [Candidatus Auribacterota bacterium]
MFLFLRLILAHLIADFPLQTDNIYRLKIKGHLGLFLHSLIIFFVSLLFVLPLLKLPVVWILLILIMATHYLIDWLKVRYSKQLKLRSVFWGFILDQVLHVSIYLPCFLVNTDSIDIYITKPGFLANFYNSDPAIIFAIFLIIAVFASFYLIETLKTSYFPNIISKDQPRYIMYFELFERLIYFISVFMSGYYLIIIPVMIAVRYLFGYMIIRNEGCRRAFLSWIQTGLNLALPVISGSILNFIL